MGKLQDEKAALREKMKQLRDAIPAEERARQSKVITEMILGTQLYQDAVWIMTYVSFGSEVDTRELIRRAIRDNKRVYAPHIDGDRIGFYEVENLGKLTENSFGIPEPPKSAIGAFPYDLHLSLDRGEQCVFFVPGLAFDEKLNRLGYGRGYYDRYLSQFRKKMAIGLAFSEQVVDAVPNGPMDTALDLVVTPNGAFF